jgi:transposase
MARRPRKYRLWTAEEKRSICLQTLSPGVSVAQVARRYSMNANLIFKWLKDSRYAPEPDADIPPVFLPVEITPPVSERASSCTSVPMNTPCRGGLGRVEIVLPGGARLTIEGSSDADDLVRLIKGLIG